MSGAGRAAGLLPSPGLVLWPAGPLSPLEPVGEEIFRGRARIS